MAQNQNNGNQQDPEVQRLKQIVQRQQQQIKQLEQRRRSDSEKIRTLRNEVDAIKAKINVR